MPSDDTRNAIISSAEKLFAKKGIDAASLREINSLAGQKNSTSLQYHFEDRAGLLKAVLAKHYMAVEYQRHALLDEIESTHTTSIRTLAAALVRPLASKLEDDSGGREYLQIMAEILNRPDLLFRDLISSRKNDSTDRWRSMVGKLLPDVAVSKLHRRFVAIRIAHLELSRRAASPKRRDNKLFTSDLIDIVTSILEAPVSKETEQYLSNR